MGVRKGTGVLVNRGVGATVSVGRGVAVCVGGGGTVAVGGWLVTVKVAGGVLLGDGTRVNVGVGCGGIYGV